MRRQLFAVLTGSFLLLSAATSFSQSAAEEEAAIRGARDRSNEAIRRHDADQVASFWAEDYSLVSSTNLQLTGRETNRSSIAEHFAQRLDVFYVRTPKEIGFYLPWEMAYEIGTWKGGWTESEGSVTIGGTYLAKWQKASGVWLIQAELFVPTHCEGTSYCAEKR